MILDGVDFKTEVFREKFNGMGDDFGHGVALLALGSIGLIGRHHQICIGLENIPRFIRTINSKQDELPFGTAKPLFNAPTPRTPRCKART